MCFGKKAYFTLCTAGRFPERMSQVANTGDLREAGAPIPVPTAMSPEELQADFQQSHSMLVQTDAWEKLNRVTASPEVVAVNPLPLPKSCHAHAPI